MLKHCTLGIGFFDLAEALIALTGKHHGEDKKSQELGIEIIKFMNNKIKFKGSTIQRIIDVKKSIYDHAKK